MAKYPSNPLLLVALLCAFAAAGINSLDQNGICKSLVETQGYTCQDHQVTTEDGYILGLQRIPSGRSSNNSTGEKLPVLLQHGLTMDAAAGVLSQIFGANCSFTVAPLLGRVLSRQMALLI